jgi:hypothetical protein
MVHHVHGFIGYRTCLMRCEVPKDCGWVLEKTFLAIQNFSVVFGIKECRSLYLSPALICMSSDGSHFQSVQEVLRCT